MSAVISTCGRYRYLLQRKPRCAHPEKSTALFCMLNPSTADAEQDDATIRRLRGYADDWRCNGLTVVNLYAYRATDPRELWKTEDPFGPENEFWLRKAAYDHGGVVCAWGANARPDNVKHAMRLFAEVGATTYALALTKDGTPKHPLYLRRDLRPSQWPTAEFGTKP